MTILKNLVSNSKQLILYGLMLGLLIFVLKWMQWQFLIRDNSIDIYVGLIAIFFTVLGLWIATQLIKPKIETVFIEKEIIIHQTENFILNETELNRLNLSNREYEILQLLTKGKSNAEIAGNLFLSVSTIKTHVSNIFIKMDVKSRAQAIEKSKRLRITQ